MRTFHAEDCIDVEEAHSLMDEVFEHLMSISDFMPNPEKTDRMMRNINTVKYYLSTQEQQFWRLNEKKKEAEYKVEQMKEAIAD